MINPFQIILAVVVLVLTSILTLVGIQVFLILREVQKTIRKVNATLDDFQGVVADFSQSLEGAAGFLGGLKTVLRLLGVFKKREKHE